MQGDVSLLLSRRLIPALTFAGEVNVPLSSGQTIAADVSLRLASSVFRSNHSSSKSTAPRIIKVFSQVSSSKLRTAFRVTCRQPHRLSQSFCYPCCTMRSYFIYIPMKSWISLLVCLGTTAIAENSTQWIYPPGTPNTFSNPPLAYGYSDTVIVSWMYVDSDPITFDAKRLYSPST